MSTTAYSPPRDPSAAAAAAAAGRSLRGKGDGGCSGGTTRRARAPMRSSARAAEAGTLPTAGRSASSAGRSGDARPAASDRCEDDVRGAPTGGWSEPEGGPPITGRASGGATGGAAGAVREPVNVRSEATSGAGCRADDSATSATPEADAQVPLPVAEVSMRSSCVTRPWLPRLSTVMAAAATADASDAVGDSAKLPAIGGVAPPLPV